MCTIVVMRNVFPNYPFVVAANRDELLDRPSEPPKIRDGLLTPKDLQRGGTWIGVNEKGVFFGLTNRLNVKSERGRDSRGDLVLRALSFASAREAFESLSMLDGKRFNGFHLVIGDSQNLYLIKGDGKQFQSSEHGDGLLIVTNHGTNQASDDFFKDLEGQLGIGALMDAAQTLEEIRNVPRRNKNIEKCWSQHQTDASLKEVASLLHLHDEGRHGTCIHEPENNYGTKSSSFVRLLPDAWEYQHRERSGLEKHICQDAFQEPLYLPLGK